jgi:hypothetical protein
LPEWAFAGLTVPHLAHAHAQGTTIEVTLWREFAEKFYDHLEVDQVGPPETTIAVIPVLVALVFDDVVDSLPSSCDCDVLAKGTFACNDWQRQY